MLDAIHGWRLARLIIWLHTDAIRGIEAGCRRAEIFPLTHWTTKPKWAVQLWDTDGQSSVRVRCRCMLKPCRWTAFFKKFDILFDVDPHPPEAASAAEEAGDAAEATVQRSHSCNYVIISSSFGSRIPEQLAGAAQRGLDASRSLWAAAGAARAAVTAARRKTTVEQQQGQHEQQQGQQKQQQRQQQQQQQQQQHLCSSSSGIGRGIGSGTIPLFQSLIVGSRPNLESNAERLFFSSRHRLPFFECHPSQTSMTTTR